ncbi:MAG: malto-oligosyltrehalose synthase, partial [Blastocatellia bacterium]
PSSRYAHFFDIEWHPVKDELADKLLIPILGDQYGAALEQQELRLSYTDGNFTVQYSDVVLPIAPDTYASILMVGLEDLATRAPVAEVDELHSVVTACINLPSRRTREADQIATRAREKEIIKRRLGALVDSSDAIRAYLAATVARFNGSAGQPRSFDLLDQLLNDQSYRLAYWRVASEEINYRRFFDVNDLAALRVEDPAVFEEVHRFVFDLVRRRAATGLRVDHVDGLYAPADYLRRLQRRAAELLDRPSDHPLFIVVEKILGPDEPLPAEWPVNGTTGYDFSAVVNNIFVDRRSERALTNLYARFIRERRERLSFADLAYRSKKQVLHETMSGDINSLGHQLNRYSERNRHFRDFTLYSLISTIKEVIACFPVYRTYVTEDGPVSERDHQYIVEAIRSARQRAPGFTSVVFDFIERVLLKTTAVTTPEECSERARFIGKFQQITSPIAAKGIEDTALYVYNRLLSLNEVGSDPTRFGLEPAAVHEWMADRQQRWPTALSTLSTHDSKRGEDMRARLNVLSEIPGAWKAAVTKWRSVNRRFKTEVRGAPAPDGNEEYFLYQTLVGAWPFDISGDAFDDFRRRLDGYLVKALREAKVHTTWLSPNETYEAAVLRFAAAILNRDRANPFLQSFLPFQARVAELGIYNSLSQLLIKITAPGVPDFYQGTELWDLTLVDPDNRRQVAYDTRRRFFAEIRADDDTDAPALLEWEEHDVAREMVAVGGSKPLVRVAAQHNGSGASAAVASDRLKVRTDALTDLLEQRPNGHIKMFVIARALAARRHLQDVYELGAYIPIQTAGTRRDSVFAFARAYGGRMAITCVPRLIASLVPNGTTRPLGRAVWTDTTLELDAGAAQGRATGSPRDSNTAEWRRFRDVFSGAIVEADVREGRFVLPASTLFEHFPVALLIGM